MTKNKIDFIDIMMIVAITGIMFSPLYESNLDYNHISSYEVDNSYLHNNISNVLYDDIKNGE